MGEIENRAEMIEASKEKVRLTNEISDLAVEIRDLKMKLFSAEHSLKGKEYDLELVTNNPEVYFVNREKEKQWEHEIQIYGRELMTL